MCYQRSASAFLTLTYGYRCCINECKYFRARGLFTLLFATVVYRSDEQALIWAILAIDLICHPLIRRNASLRGGT